MAFSLSSAGHYLVFDSSDLSIERKEQSCICRLLRFQTDVVVRIYPSRNCIFFGLSLLSAREDVWRFESVHSFGSVGNLYQKMHFVGSNLSTDPKCPKCIYKISKNFRVEKNGEISRNLRFSLVFVPASKSDTHHGWDGRI